MRCSICTSQNTEIICRTSDIEYNTTKDIYEYYKCLDCGVIFLSNIPEDILNIIYPDNYYSNIHQNNLVYVIKKKLDILFFKKIIKNIPGENLSVLDIGGGNSDILDSVRDSDERVKSTLIIDINDSQEKIAINKGHDFKKMRVEEFYSDKKFDLIIMFNLIEHVKNPLEILKKSFSLLSNHGVVLVKTPNTDSLNFKLFKNRDWGGYHAPRHWVLFNNINFRNICKNIGFKYVNHYFTQGAPQWCASFYSLLFNKGYLDKYIENKKVIYQYPLYNFFMAIFAIFDFIRIYFAKTDQMVFKLSNKQK